MKLGVAAVLGFAVALAASAEPPQTKISVFSGKPVPRFESLRYSAVHGRAGPSLDHPILWRYEREGLPVLVIKESLDWRRVRDPDGAEVWVMARMLSSNPTIFARSDVTLRRSPHDDAPAVAVLAEGGVAEVIGEEGGWIRLEAAGRRGWARREGFWGVAPDEAGL